MSRRPASRMRGAALLLVMWLIALLTALIGAFALTARMEYLQGRVGSGASVAGQAARAGLEYALVRVADAEPTTRWQPDGLPYDWRFGGATLSITVEDEAGKIDLNQADGPLFSRLMQVLGVDAGQADVLAAAILDWRDIDDLGQPKARAEDPDYAAAGLPYGAKDAPFESLEELQQVLGMTPALYRQLVPYLTLYSGRSLPDAEFAAGPVLAAMGQDAPAVLARRAASRRDQQVALVALGSGTYSIGSQATLADGRTSTLQAVVRVGAGPIPGSAYTVLRWKEGTALQ